MSTLKKIGRRVSSYTLANMRLKAAKFIANSIGMPNLAGVLVTQSRLWLNPIEYRKRRNFARLFSGKAANQIRISQETGFCAFTESGYPEVSEVVKSCNEILNQKGRENLDSWYEKRATSYSKSFFYNLLDEDDVIEHPILMNFALSEKVQSIVVPYFGFIPRLCSIGLYYSKKSEKVAGSQNFHIDGTDPHHVKCFVNISNVGPKNGPLTFIPADKTEYLRKSNGGMLHSAGLEDRELLERYEKDFGVSLTGEPGCGAFVDASRCLHYGSRCEENHRIVFMFHYAVFANYTELEKNPLRDIRMQHYPRIRGTFGVDEVRKSLLKID